MNQTPLSAVQARVLAALVEKSITTPQYYPMTVNAIVNACNQKSCRWPLMQLGEGEVGSALLDLSERGLAAREDGGGRVPKWRQRMRHQMLLQPATQAILVTLMLRGPQTVAELRTNAASLKGPDDAEGVQNAIEDLADRAEPMVRWLERQPGQKEERCAHLLCGEPDVADLPRPRRAASAASSEALEQRVAALEAAVARLQTELGLDPQ